VDATIIATWKRIYEAALVEAVDEHGVPIWYIARKQRVAYTSLVNRIRFARQRMTRWPSGYFRVGPDTYLRRLT
jgi:methionyl-tRNA synthetase